MESQLVEFLGNLPYSHLAFLQAKSHLRVNDTTRAFMREVNKLSKAHGLGQIVWILVIKYKKKTAKCFSTSRFNYSALLSSYLGTIGQIPIRKLAALAVGRFCRLQDLAVEDKKLRIQLEDLKRSIKDEEANFRHYQF